jgi:hypothetical protein
VGGPLLSPNSDSDNGGVNEGKTVPDEREPRVVPTLNRTPDRYVLH